MQEGLRFLCFRATDTIWRQAFSAIHQYWIRITCNQYKMAGLSSSSFFFFPRFFPIGAKQLFAQTKSSSQRRAIIHKKRHKQPRFLSLTCSPQWRSRYLANRQVYLAITDFNLLPIGIIVKPLLCNEYLFCPNRTAPLATTLDEVHFFKRKDT